MLAAASPSVRCPCDQNGTRTGPGPYKSRMSARRDVFLEERLCQRYPGGTVVPVAQPEPPPAPLLRRNPPGLLRGIAKIEKAKYSSLLIEGMERFSMPSVTCVQRSLLPSMDMPTVLFGTIPNHVPHFRFNIANSYRSQWIRYPACVSQDPTSQPASGHAKVTNHRSSLRLRRIRFTLPSPRHTSKRRPSPATDSQKHTISPLLS